MANPSEQSIDQFFSLLSHELRTPITTLQGAIALLRAHQLKEKSDIEALISLAAESTDRLTQVIEDLLNWYDITHNTPGLVKQSCNLSALILQAIAALNPFARHQQIQLHLNSPTWIPLQANPYYLNQALVHLIHNAIKFSKPGDTVWITATCMNPENVAYLPFPAVQIVVQDQGAGISEDTLAGIFQPFRQSDSSDTRAYGGLGLQLAICHAIIQHHQGKIGVQSRLGQGTTFTVLLPLETVPCLPNYAQESHLP